MTQQTVTSTNKTIGGLLVAAVATCSFAAAALGPAPTANATCASFSGINFGSGCTSSFGGMAIAIGAGATASALGFLSTAFAAGSNATASVHGALNLGVAAGTNATAVTGESGGGDFANVAMTFGDNSVAQAGVPGGGGFGNMATNLGNGSQVAALGVLNMASNTGDGDFAVATGVANNASNFGGTGNVVQAASTDSNPAFNRAFAFLSNGTTVAAGPGPFALAGSIFQTGANITKQGPGFNINGLTVGGAAAPAGVNTASAIGVKKPAKKAAVAGSRAHAASAAPKHVSKK
jgi:hypothetical protein